MFYDFLYAYTRQQFSFAHTQRPEGHYTKSKAEEIFGKLKKICREGSKEKKITFDQGEYYCLEKKNFNYCFI